MKILIATMNPGKLEEIKYFLKDLPLELLDLSKVKVKGEPFENGLTFTENAIKKAKFYLKETGLPTIADDGGLEIDFLHGEPGVKSKRWIYGKETSDKELIEHTLNKLKGVPLSKRKAQLRTVVAIALPDGKIFTIEEKTRGIIAITPSQSITRGFPYRALFYLPKLKKYYNPDELTKKEYEKIGHRGRAVRKLAKLIKNHFMI